MMLQPKIIIIVDISKNEYYYHHHCNYYLVFSWPWHADSIYWVYVIPKEFYSFFTNFFIYMFTLFVWSSVRFYPINVKTAEPIGPKFCVGPHMTPGKVYECSELRKVVSKTSLFS